LLRAKESILRQLSLRHCCRGRWCRCLHTPYRPPRAKSRQRICDSPAQPPSAFRDCAVPPSMRTCVRMYVISDPSQPHLALGTAATLDALASTLAARSDSNLVVYVNRDGLSHALDAAERRELDELIQAARSALRGCSTLGRVTGNLRRSGAALEAQPSVRARLRLARCPPRRARR
jgi:hypothetical protein